MEDNNSVQPPIQPTAPVEAQPITPTPPIQPQPIIQPQPEQAKAPNNPNGFPLKPVLFFAVLMLFLVIIVITGGVYYLNSKAKLAPSPASNAANATPIATVKPTSTPTPDPTANWKIYTNTKSGYSVKYPSDIYVRIICPDEELLLTTRTAQYNEDTITMPGCERGGRYTIEVVTADSFTELVTDDFVSVTKSEIEVGGVTAREYISIKKPAAEGPIPDYSDDIYVDYKGKHYLIHFDKIDSDLKLKILSTFKFTQ